MISFHVFAIMRNDDAKKYRLIIINGKAFLKYLTKDRSELLATKEALARQVENLQDEVYRLRMERDALVVAGEILKKDRASV